MTLWTAAEAARATGGTTNTHWTASGVSIDSRSLQQGDLFIALNAARDGHEFVADALAKGACAALVSRRPPGVSVDAPLLTVVDVQQGLEDLGRAARARAGSRRREGGGGYLVGSTPAPLTASTSRSTTALSLTSMTSFLRGCNLCVIW